MTLKGGTSQACAACKYQRRRCMPDCQLAPYFPADQPKIFQNAHRLFGVSNILKILKEVDPRLRAEAMRSIINESDVRSKSPVLGCSGYIYELQCRVRVAEEELQIVRSQIAMCKMQQYKNVNNDDGQVSIEEEDEDNTSILYLGMGPPAKETMTNNQNAVNGMMMMFENDVPVENEQFWGNLRCGVGNNLVESQLDNQLKVQQHFVSPQYRHILVNNIGIQQQEQIQMGNMMNKNLVHHFEGMHTFLDGIDDPQSFVDSKAVPQL